MSIFGSVKSRFQHPEFGFGYAGANVIVGDGQIEFGMTHLSGEPLGIGVLETGEVKDLILLLSGARRAAIQQMMDFHAQTTGHTHTWGVDPALSGETISDFIPNVSEMDFEHTVECETRFRPDECLQCYQSQPEGD